MEQQQQVEEKVVSNKGGIEAEGSKGEEGKPGYDCENMFEMAEQRKIKAQLQQTTQQTPAHPALLQGMTPSQRVSLMLQKFRKPDVTQRNVDQPKVCHVFPQRKSAPHTLKKPSGFAGGLESFLQTPAAKRSLFAKEQIDFEKSISGISRHAYARNMQ